MPESAIAEQALQSIEKRLETERLLIAASGAFFLS